MKINVYVKNYKYGEEKKKGTHEQDNQTFHFVCLYSETEHLSIQNTNMNLEQLANKTRIQLYEERQKSLIIILTTNKYKTNTSSSDASVIEFLSILVTA